MVYVESDPADDLKGVSVREVVHAVFVRVREVAYDAGRVFSAVRYAAVPVEPRPEFLHQELQGLQGRRSIMTVRQLRRYMNEERFDELSAEFDRIVEDGERIDPPDDLGGET